MTNELLKLEAMYYHARSKRHVKWLESNPEYRNLRVICPHQTVTHDTSKQRFVTVRLSNGL